MKKVLIYTERWSVGGIESLIVNLIKNMNKDKFDVNILVSQKETEIYDDYLKEIKVKEILEKKCKNPFIRIFKTITKFRKSICNKGIDVIHVNVYNGVGMIYSYIAYKSGIKKVIVHAHNTGIDNDKFRIKYILHSICKTMFSKYAHSYIACSEEAAKFCFNVPKNKNLTIINNGIDTEKFVYRGETRKKFRKQFNLEGCLVIGNIARFVEQKNHDFLIDIFVELKKEIHNVKLVLVGDGNLKEKIYNKIMELKLKNDVVILNSRNDIDSILQMFDIFCFPSKYEGLGIAVIEAQACGNKCVVSDRVPERAKITPNIISISLNNDAKIWANRIVQYQSKEIDKNTTKYIRLNGYDIRDNTMKIEEIYLF